VDAYRSARAGEKFIAYSVHAPFHPTWHKIGMENMMVWMHEDPDFVVDMFATHTQLVIDLYEGIRELGVEYDAAWFSDDLGYRNAPLISPAMYRELVMPHHRRLCDRFAADGLKTILHSDGNVGPLIPHFLEAGFAALHPLEAKAGLDVRELKPRYGDRLVLFGNIDVRKLAGSREAIEEELRAKVTVAKEGGGYIYHSDHSVPNDVSFENYRFAVEMLKKYGRYD
jgi:uroporphyrinogen decarboxylase